MKYVCTVCGYVYDEDIEKVPFAELPDSWTCPMCGAPKSLFEKEEGPEEGLAKTPDAPAPEKGEESERPEDFQRLGAGEMAALFSNLQRGCEKQYQAESAKGFAEIAGYFASRTPDEADPKMEDLAALAKDDLEDRYKKLRREAEKAGDRGMLRAIVWGEKVTRMARSLMDRCQKEGAAFLENTGLWVCSVCGFMFLGEKPPAICPVCKVPGWKFEKIEDPRRVAK